MSRVVIIGGSGHVGAYLVPRLVSAGFKVVSVSRRQRARISRMVRLLCPAKLMRYRCLRTESSIEFASEIPRELGKRFRRPRFPGLPVGRDCVYEGRGSAVGVCHRDRVTPVRARIARAAVSPGGSRSKSEAARTTAIRLKSMSPASAPRLSAVSVALSSCCVVQGLASPPATSFACAIIAAASRLPNHQVSDEIVSQIVTLGGAAAADSGYLAR